VEHDLNDMMVFLAVVEAGSFTLAAERLAIPKANISRKVTRLEQRLSVVLLERSTRSQHLTEAGSRYLQHCKSIHTHIDLAESEIFEVLNAVKGNLKVGASVSVGQQILQPVLSKFLHQYPALNLQLNLVNRRVNFIEEGFDVLIRVGNLDDSSLIAKKLGTVTRKIFASPEYFSNREIPQLLSELTQCDWLMMNMPNNDNKLTFKSVKNTQQLALTPRYLVDDFLMLKQSLVDGLGVAVMPEYMCKAEIEQGTLINILPQWGMESVDMYALYPQYRAKIPKVKAFLAFIEEVFTHKLNLK
jgi:LysR family transcriptional regulator AphB